MFERRIGCRVVWRRAALGLLVAAYAAGGWADSRVASSGGGSALLFYAPFDDTAVPAFAKGGARPIREQKLAYGEGVREKAVCLSAQEGSVLDYAWPDNMARTRGTVCLWFRRAWPDGGHDAAGKDICRMLFACRGVKTDPFMLRWQGDRLRLDAGADGQGCEYWTGLPPADEWSHLAVTWDEKGMRAYLNGRDLRELATPCSADAAKLRELQRLDGRDAVVFSVGHFDGTCQADGMIDGLRIYSTPLTAKQLRELWRRETVVQLSASGCYALADTMGELTVKATSPSKCDISKLAYCICDEAGKVLCRYKDRLTGKPTVLKVNLPVGRYALRTTDGTWFYGSVPVVVMRRENPHVGEDAALKVNEPQAARDPGDLARLLHDLRTKGEDRLSAHGERMRVRQVGIDYAALMPADRPFVARAARWLSRPDILCDEIERAAAAMKARGLNLLILPPFAAAQAELLTAWRIKFAVEGLHVETEGKAKGAPDLRMGDSTVLLPKDAVPPPSFVQAFRALPAVAFDEEAGAGPLKLRHADFEERSWFYVLNSDVKPVTVKLAVPKRTCDLATGERVGGMFSGETLTFRLKPHEMRSFAAPEGFGRILSQVTDASGAR